MGNAIEIARTMFEEYGVYAIIDRQPTASLLSRIWGDSIVELSLSNYAIVKTILKRSEEHTSELQSLYS